MKKLFAAILVVVMIVSLCACSKETKWKAFIKEYNKWADEYIALVEKAKANPSDPSILSESVAMAQEAAEWSAKADEIAEELEDPDEAAKFAAELLKISAKLAKAAQ